MADDDEVRDETSFDPTFATAGPRRSTFTPPPASVQQPSSAEAVTDDDALADALAADLGRIAQPVTGTIPVAPPVAAPAAPPPAAPAAPEPASEPASEPAPEAAPEPPPWSSLPAPDPSQAVPLPDDRPVRQSLPDEELLEWVDEAGRQPGGTLNVIEGLETQLRLREEEARQFHAWEDRMRSVGTPDALEAVEEARPEFTGVLPNVPVPPGLQIPPAPETGVFVLPETPMAEWPAPHFEDVVDPVPPPVIAEEPELDEAAEVDTSADEVADNAAAVEDTVEAPPVAPTLPVWDISPPSATWSPGPEYGVEPEPELAPEPEPAPAPELVSEPEPEPEPVSEPEPELEPEPFEAQPEPEDVVSAEPAAPDFSGAPSEFPAAPAAEPWVLSESLDEEAEEPAPFEPAESLEQTAPMPEPDPFDLLLRQPEAAPEPVEEPPSRFDFSAVPPAEGLVPAEPIEPLDSAEPVDSFDLAEQVEPAEPVQSFDSAESLESSETVEDVEDVELAEPAPFDQPESVAPAPFDLSEPEPTPPYDPFEQLLRGPEPVEASTEPEPPSSAAAWEPTPWEPTPSADITDEMPAFEPTSGPDEDVYVVDEPVVDEPFVDEPVVDEPVVDEPVVDEPVVDEPVVDEPVVEEPEPEPEPAAAPFSPPPLIEPPAFGGPPILPSEAASLPPIVAPPEPAQEPPLQGEGSAFDFRPDAPIPTTPPATEFSFDDLLSGEEPPLHPDPEPATVAEAAPEATFVEPLPVSANEPVPTDTDSIPIIDRAYDEELEDDVDETDRAFDGVIGAVSVDTSGIAVINAQVSPPSGPISTMRIPEDEVVLIDNEPVKQPVFSLEDSGLEPTPTDHRVGRAARLFWLWFAAHSSILSLGLGAAVFAVGMNLRQSMVAIFAGVVLSAIPLGLTTLAGKRSGQPTMVVSRATFGLLGNVVPALLALLTRLFWGAVLLWLLASSVAIVLVGAGLNGSLGERQLLLVSLAAAFLVAVLIAFAGYPLLARIQLILSIVSGALIVGLIAMTAQYIDLPAAVTKPDGPWLLTVTGAVLVFSFVGLVWATSGADLARYQRPGSSGATSALWAGFGSLLPSFLLIGYGAMLAASDEGIASGFLLSPLDTLALMLPSWYPVPLLAATALSLLSGITITLYSGGFALQSIGVRLPRQWSIVIVGVLLAGLALVLTFGVSGGMNELFRDLATTLAVPTAAWAGIFAAETMIRNRRFESQSLLTRGGVYADVRWVNLISLLLITAIGFGLTSATVTWLSWQGFGFTLLGIPLDGDLAGTDVGVLVALALGLLTPIVAGIPAIRKQEAMRV